MWQCYSVNTFWILGLLILPGFVHDTIVVE